MESAYLPEAAATCQQNSYTISQRCALFVFRHANLRTTGQQVIFPSLSNEPGTQLLFLNRAYRGDNSSRSNVIPIGRGERDCKVVKFTHNRSILPFF
jgi:hypothetical protein